VVPFSNEPHAELRRPKPRADAVAGVARMRAEREFIAPVIIDGRRLPLDTETALFRIVQESLINIHRHAGSESARIRLRRGAETLVLEIEDRGHGIPTASLKQIIRGRGVVGVGIAGMGERIQQLGGRLEITSSNQGTTVRAGLPLVENAA